MRNRSIVTTFIHPPIPVRCFDWQAYYEDEGEEAGRYGYGTTKEAAIKELKQKFDWNELRNKYSGDKK